MVAPQPEAVAAVPAQAQPMLSPPMNVDEHIAKLKEAARNTSPDARATAYLPPPEVAKTIPCRYYPNCTRAGCTFFHPLPAAQAASSGSPAGGVIANAGVAAGQQNGQQVQQVQVQQDAQNGYSANGANGYDVNASMQQQAEQQQQQMHMSAMYYGGYDPNADYMQHYASQNPYMAAHQQQQAYYGYQAYPQQNQQVAYQPYPNPYYAQQGMYASVPPMPYTPQHQYDPSAYQQQQPQSHQQSASNGQTQTDPAIISQGSKRTSPSHPSAALQSSTSPSAPAGSAGMQKSASSNSNKSSKSAKKAAAATSSTSTTSDNNTASVNTNVVQEPASQSVQSPSQSLSQQNSVPASSPPAAQQPMSPSYYQSMPLDQMQAQQQLYAAQQNGSASQNQLEADFAQASLNGQHQRMSSVDGGDASKKHERTSSAQMRTLYQTGGDSSAPIAQTPYPAPVPTNALSASTARPIHTGPRLHEAQNAAALSSGNGFNGHRRELSASMNGIPTGPKRPFNGMPGGPGPRPAGGAPQRNGARNFDPRGPTPACRYFAESNCRFGDNCHFVHQMNHSRPLPNDAEGKMTSDARLVKQNIGGPDGGIAVLKARNSREMPQGGKYGFNGTAVIGQPPQQQQGTNGQAPARFAQQNGFHLPEKKDGQTALNGNPEEQLQKLIAEMPRSPMQNGHASGKAASMPAQQQPARANPIPPTLGSRPHATPSHKQAGPFSHNNRNTNGQRIPNGENDFPALLGAGGATSNGMERGGSASSAGATAPAQSTAIEAEAPATPAATVASPVIEKKEEAAAPSTASTSADKPTPASAVSAPAKPAFSWASAAAKAASLPDPPKRAPSKARTAAPAKDSSKEAESAPPVPAAAQTLAAEATAAPAVQV